MESFCHSLLVTLAEIEKKVKKEKPLTENLAVHSDGGLVAAEISLRLLPDLGGFGAACGKASAGGLHSP